MTDRSWPLDYRTSLVFTREVIPSQLERGDRIKIKRVGEDDYDFVFVRMTGNRLEGVNVARSAQVFVDMISLTLTEHSTT